MTKYVLSYTPLLNDKKEYVLSISSHVNVYNDNNYIVAFNPWSVYSADIIDDMVRARKMRVKASRVLLKEANPILNMDGKIDDGLVNSKIAINSKNSVGSVTKGKNVMRGKVLPMQIEEGITSLKAKLDDKVSNFIYASSNVNIVNLLDDAFLILTKDATTIGIEWSEIINSGSVEGTDLGVHVKEIYNALKDEMESKQLAPLRFINTEHTVSTLLHKVGYRSDKLTERLDLNRILIGDQIGSQLNAILLQNIYKATDIALNMSKLKSKSMFIMGSESPLKLVSKFLADKMNGSLSNVSHFTESIKDNDIEESRTVNTTDSKLQRGIEHSRTVSSSHASNFERIGKADVITGSETSAFGDVEKAVNSTKIYGGSKSSIEDGKTIKPVIAKVDRTLDWATTVSGAESEVFNLYGAKVVSGKKVSNLFKLEEADMVLSSTTDNGKTLNRVKVSKKSFVRNLMVNERATMKLSVSGINVRELINSIFTKEYYNTGSMEIEDAILSKDKYDSVVNSLDDMTFNIKLDSRLHSIDKSIVNNLMQSIIMSETEHGSVEESVIDTILEFLVEGSDNKVEIDVDFSNLVESDASEGVKDVELSTYNNTESRMNNDAVLDNIESSIPYMVKDVFMFVVGTTGESKSHKEVSMNTLEYVDGYNSDVDTVLDKVERNKADNNNLVYFEKVEEVIANCESTETEIHDVDSTTLFDSSIEASIHRLNESDEIGLPLEVVVDFLETVHSAKEILEISMESTDVSGIVGENHYDVELESTEVSKTEEVILNVEVSKIEISNIDNTVIETLLETLEMVSQKSKDVGTELDDSITAESKRSEIETGLDYLATTEVISADNETGLDYLEVVSIGKGILETGIDDTATVIIEAADKETLLEKLEKIDTGISVKDTSFDRIAEVDMDIAVKDTSIENISKLDHSLSIKDTTIDEAEGYDRYVEYEGTDNEMEDFVTDRKLYSDSIAELEDGTSNKEPVKTNRPSEIDSADKYIEVGGTIATNGGAEVDRSLTTDTIAEIESSNRNTEIEAIYDDGQDLGTKFSSLKLTIGDGSLADSELDYKVGISEAELSNRERELEMEVGKDYSANRGKSYFTEITVTESGDKEVEFEATDSSTEETTKSDPKLKLNITSSDAPYIDKNYRTGTTDADLGSKDKEIDLGEIPDGIGGEVKPGDPEHPVIDPDPKDKIWMIMGKNYPSWQNWNPKKTR